MTQTYAQLARQIAVLQASAQKQLAVEAKGAIAKINETIAKYGLTVGDLKFASTSATASPSASKKTKATTGNGGDVAKDAKFSDGQGNQWGGRGPRPAWLRNAIAAGRTLASFAGGAVSATTASVALQPAEKAPAKSTASKRIKSGAGRAKAKSRKASAAETSSASAAIVAPAVASTNTVKLPVKKSPASKGGATKTVRASNAMKKTASPKTPVAVSKPVAPTKKSAAQKAGPTRKKAGAKSTLRNAAVVNAAPEAVAATAAP